MILKLPCLGLHMRNQAPIFNGGIGAIELSPEGILTLFPGAFFFVEKRTRVLYNIAKTIRGVSGLSVAAPHAGLASESYMVTDQDRGMGNGTEIKRRTAGRGHFY